MVLSQIGAEVTVVDDGEKALSAFQACTFDIVLMDMHMPVRDGLSATRAIRAFEKGALRAPTPLIMLTANASPEHISASLAAGANSHIAKPFTAANLISEVLHLVGEDEADIEASALVAVGAGI